MVSESESQPSLQYECSCIVAHGCVVKAVDF